MIETVIKMEIAQSVIALINPIIIGFLLVVAFLGYKSGLLLQVFGLLNVVIKIIVAWIFAPIVARVFVLYNPDLGMLNESALDELLAQQVNTVLWFVIIYVGLSVLFLLVKPLLKTAGKLPLVKTVNQMLGFLFGLVKGVVYLLIVVFLLSTPLFVNGREAVEQSYLSNIEESAPLAFDAFSDWASSSPALARLMAGELLSEEDTQAIEEWLIKQELEADVISDILERLPTSDE